MLITSTVKRVYKLLPDGYKGKSVGILLLIVVSSVLDLMGLGVLIPLMTVIIKENPLENELLHTVYNFLGLSSEFDLVVYICAGVLTIILLKNLFALLISRHQARYSRGLARDLGMETLEKRYNKGVDSLSDKSSNDIMWQINSLPSIFVTNLLMPLLSIFNELLILIMIFASILYLDAQVLLILSIVIIPGILIFYQAVKNTLTRNQEEMADLTPVISAKAQQLVFGFLDVKISTKFEFFRSQFYTLKDRMKRLMVVNYVLNQIPTRLLETLVILGAVVLILYGKSTNAESDYLINVFGMFALASYKLVPSVNKLSAAILSIKSNQFTLQYLERELKATEPQSAKTEIGEFEQLELQNFSFEYEEGLPVLKQLHLILKRGEKIGLIGKSGGGKTTLMNCLLGFFSDYTGSLKINDTELNTVNHDTWLSQLGYVKQNVFLIDGTIKENITFGIEPSEINEAQLLSAVEKSSLAEFIATLPEGLDSKTGELGSSLSGGQRQRIGIARALYFGAKVLFFDEATSALDNETEGEIVETLQNLSLETEITMIIIAHRHSTLKHCDTIYELSEGVISRELTYDQL